MKQRLLVITACIALPILWLYIYPAAASLLGYEPLAPRHSIVWLRFVPVVTDPGTMIEFSGAITMAALPIYLYAGRRARFLEALEGQVAGLLSLYSGLLASAGSASSALLAASRLLSPPISLMVEQMARIYMLTGDIEQAFREAFRGAPRRVRIYAYSLVVATRSRGMAHRVLGAAASHAESTRRLLSLVRARLSEYSFVAVLASITYAFSAGIVVGLVEKLSALSVLGLSRVNPGIMLGLYYYSLLVIVAASAIIVSRVIRGYSLYAAKYIALLTLPDTLILVLSPKLVA